MQTAHDRLTATSPALGLEHPWLAQRPIDYLVINVGLIEKGIDVSFRVENA